MRVRGFSTLSNLEGFFESLHSKGVGFDAFWNWLDIKNLAGGICHRRVVSQGYAIFLIFVNPQLLTISRDFSITRPESVMVDSSKSTDRHPSQEANTVL